MKKLILAALILTVSGASYGQTYMTRTGKISFNATSKTSPEKIEAVNNETASVLNGATGDFVFQVLIKSFKFESGLMQEHFNENYLESDKYPKSDFKGKISNFGDVNLKKDGTYNVTVTGKLTIHGVTQEVSVPGTVVVKGKDVTAKAKFNVKLADYKVEIPKLVADKVAKEASLVIDATLVQK